MSKFQKTGWQCLVTVLLAIAMVGCSDKAKEDLEGMKSKVAAEVKSTGEKAGEMAGKAGDKIKEGAAALSEDVLGFLGPIKEQLGSLDSLKEKPAELKAAAEKLIALIESKTESIKLPEGIQKTVDTLKEKLVKLKDYLAGDDTTPEKTSEHVDEVKNAAAGLE
jgi:hypothetical protein